MVEYHWYTTDGAVLDSLENIWFFKRLEEIGPECAYFPGESKSNLVVRVEIRRNVIFVRRTIILIFNLIMVTVTWVVSHIDDLEQEK